MQYNYICFIAVEKWETFTRRPHLEPLGDYGRLIIIESPITIKDLFKISTIRWLFHINKNILRGNIVVVRPIVIIPSNLAKKHVLLRKLYFYILKKYYDKYIIPSGYKIVMLFQPFQEYYVKQLGEDLTTFDYSDKFSLNTCYSIREKLIVSKDEHEILKKVDIVFTTSYLLESEAIKLNVNSHWLPNCIDSSFNSIDYREPNDIKLTKHPIIGFVGNINEWLDFGLINYLADLNPKYSFVFVGDVRGNIPEFTKSEDYQASIRKDNIKYLGRKSYPELFNYIKSFDVCAIYYNIDEFKKYVHPNKIYMYLSSGKPTVMTDYLPEARELFGDMVYIADSYEEFNNKIGIALNESNKDISAKRINYALNNSNLERAAKRFMHIDRLIKHYHERKSDG